MVDACMLLLRRLLLIVFCALAGCQTHDPVYRPVATEDFDRTLASWRKTRGGHDIQPLSKQQIIEAAENMLLMQRADGGWPQSTHPLRHLNPDERERFLANKNRRDSNFRHHNGFPQVFYLSHVYLQTGDVRYRNSAREGIKWVVASQFYNGGWPREPSTGQQVIDTRVTLEALIFLRKIAAGKMPYGYIPYDARRKVAEAVRKGDEWLLRVQQAHDGRKAVWARAYDLQTSEPLAHEGVEVPAMDAVLGVDIVRYLMAIERPPAAVVQAVEGAVEWYRHYSLQQWQVRESSDKQTLPARSRTFLSGPNVWSRYYDTHQYQPLSNNASELTLEARDWFAGKSNTAWYGKWATKLLREDYPRWRKKNVPEPITTNL